MPVVIACPTCLSKIRAPETAIGRQVKCPQCRSPFVAAEPLPTPDRRTPPHPSSSTEFDDEPLQSVLPASSNPEFAVPGELHQAPLASAPLPEAPGTLLDYLTFRRMVTPAIMTAVFYFGCLLILLNGLGTLAWAGFVLTLGGPAGNGGELLLGVGLILLGVVGTLIGLVFWRVSCEVLVVVFRIHEVLSEMRDRLPSR